MINGQLDEVDIKMLNYLQRDARIDVAKLSLLVHKTESPVRERLRKMQEAGFIRNYIAVLDRAKVGRPVLVVTLVKLEKQTKELLDQFERLATEMEEVQYCLHLSGKWDFLIHISVTTPQHYYEFLMERLCNLPNVAHVESSFVLKEAKSFSGFRL